MFSFPIASCIDNLKSLKSPEEKTKVLEMLGALRFQSTKMICFHLDANFLSKIAKWHILLKHDIAFHATKKNSKNFRTTCVTKTKCKNDETYFFDFRRGLFKCRAELYCNSRISRRRKERVVLLTPHFFLIMSQNINQTLCGIILGELSRIFLNNKHMSPKL